MHLYRVNNEIDLEMPVYGSDRECSFEGCQERGQSVSGLCRPHYANQYRQTPHGILVHRLGEKKRRAQKHGAGDLSLSVEQWLDILAEYEEKCAYCGADWEEQDHVIPLAKGGTHTADNVVPACAPCNRRKSDKDLCDFLEEIEVLVWN